MLAGSHLDSQPGGGRFDGVYGVVAALEVLATLAERGVRPPVDLVCVAWMNEEGSRFAPGMMGSEAFAGVRDLASIRATRDADGVSVADALDALHARSPRCAAARSAFRSLPMSRPTSNRGRCSKREGASSAWSRASRARRPSMS